MSSNPVDDWTLVREKFEALVRERSDNIDDLLDAQFCKRFSQLITHAAARGQLQARSENGGAPAATRAKIVDDPLDDSDSNFRGTVYALVIIIVFCSVALTVGMLVGINGQVGLMSITILSPKHETTGSLTATAGSGHDAAATLLPQALMRNEKANESYAAG